MLDDIEIYEECELPLAYLLTFRTFGSWLHGDKRWSVDRHNNNRYGEPKIIPSVPFVEKMEEKRKIPGVTLNETQRKLVTEAINEVCSHRGYDLRALNVRTNHVHSMVSASVKPEKIVNDFEVYSTRRLRGKWQFKRTEKVWSRGASTRYLWKPRHVEGAID